MIYSFVQRPVRFVINVSVLCALIWKTSADSPDSQIVSSQVTHRDFDSAIQQNVYKELGDDGTLVLRTNQFTILENNMHYLEDGQWKPSEDLLEVFPGGVISRRGPNQAIFSTTLNSRAVFDILTRNGGRVRGGVRRILATDFSTGESVVLATVKNDARAELLPPDRVLYADSFEGLKASVIYIWKHNLFCQEIVLLEKPVLPADFNPETVRLEIVTEYLDSNPELTEREVPFAAGIRLRDHPTISFGDLAVVTGSAFPFDTERLGTLDPGENATRVTKEWQQSENNSSVLIESVAWTEMLPHLNELPERQAALSSPVKRATALASALVRDDASSSTQGAPRVQLAQAPYLPKGYTIDFTILPDSPLTTTFRSTNTYYITNSYYSGSAVTFEPGTVVKYKTNANMVLYGPVSFPNTFQTPVFTSREDDGFGQKIENVPGETEPTTRNPANHKAAQAVWIYYVSFSTTIQNARVRWAKRGLQYDANSGVTAGHYVNNSMFENCDIGIYANLPSACATLSNSTRQNVTTPTSGGCISGSLGTVKFYGDKALAGFQNRVDTNTHNVPDTMGAIGTNYIVEMVNYRIAVFNRNTNSTATNFFQRIRSATLGQFFAVTNGTEVYPKGPVGDPRIIYDHLSQRWIACAVDFPTGNTNNQIFLAVSNGSDPITSGSSPDLADTNWISANWKKYVVNVAETDQFTDYPTLGVDKNGIYIAASFLSNSVVRHKVIAMPIGPFLNGTAPIQQPANTANIFSHQFASGSKVIQPALNFDSNPAGDIAWFLSEGSAYTNSYPGQANLYRPGKILYGGLKWNSSTGLFAKTNWFSDANSLEAPVGASGLYYWDIPDDGAGGFSAPQKNKDDLHSDLPLRRGPGTHVMSAVLRNGALWICMHVGYNSAGGYTNAAAADRSGIVWYKLDVNGASSPPTLNHTSPNPTFGRIWDGASTPYWYHFPSLSVNQMNDFVIGFGGSRSDEHVGAFFWGQRNDGTTVGRPVLVQAGRDYFPFVVDTSYRWGDYTATALDPVDGLTFCTFQEYAETNGDSALADSYWGTWITTIKLGP